MEDLFKKFVNAGVGYLSQGNKKVQATVDKLVKESKISEQEGKKIVDELLKSGETKRAELEKQFRGLADRMMSTVGINSTTTKSTSKSSGSKSKSSASGSKSASKPAAKSGSSAAGKQSSATAKAAGATKKAADAVSKTAGTAQRSAAAKAGAAKKPAAR
jgi:polyhydroxyalkanoate synthesis regulator phasin